MTGAELKTLREGLNLSAQELADILGIKAERSVRRWEDGSRAVPDDVAARVKTMDAEVDTLVEMLGDQMKAVPGLVGRVLLRYEKEADFLKYQAPIFNHTHAHRLHAAALGRFFRMPRRSKPVRLVSMNPEAYEAWRFQQGMEDDSANRCAWAVLQID